MKLNIPNTTTLSPPFPPLLQFHPKISPPRTTLTPSNHRSLRPLRRFSLLRGRQSPNFKVVRGLMREGEFLKAEDAALLVETCITRTLPPALTLEQGLEKIRVAVEELKSNPPCSTSGMYRFQVAVPPSAKALNWFCCQPESSGVFPQFFLSKENNNTTRTSLTLSGVRGVFGIGAAVYFESTPSCDSVERNSFKRYFSVDSTPVMAYGFLDNNFDSKSSSMEHEIGSFYFFIPQIELDEFDGFSTIAVTLAWNDSFLSPFEIAVQSYEISLYQVTCHFSPTTDKFYNKSIRSALRKFSMVEDKNSQMVRMNPFLLVGRDLEADNLELQGHINEFSCSLQDYANINTLWASLIVEECCRLGLTYFCVAPGSRSSPLTVAASTHPHTTCIACFDERSLAFHAIGYARGSRKPAIVITSSGTAVSNLLPAVVEASQDFVPLILLTADRPPELQDTGANQAINQVNHFGPFVRFFYGLPAPTDSIPARMVLTTIDSAVYQATSTPYGPVHINCPFREPLENTPRKWMLNCLKGLDIWMSSAEPFTNYIQVEHSYACNSTISQMAEVLKVIQGANQGLLLIGATETEDDIWAALLLAKHLLWPIVTDILSGLRLRKYTTSFPEIEESFIFVDHLDHLLLSSSVRTWAQADVIIQIGSRITSKRISQMLEDCSPCSYIMVDNHPYRHDPSHIITHRIQSSISQFSDCLLKALIPPINNKWSSFLQALDRMVAWEISFLIRTEYALTEPYVANIIPEAIHCESAIFIGNSMAIRDADMYGCNWTKCNHSITRMLNSELPCHWIQVIGNRGASGIDGLLSTAIGLSVGCNKRVLCVIGDVSFLHDTNGLALLKQRVPRKPMTIVVINNHGGAIFSLLPIADRTEERILDQYFYTSHNVSVAKLCAAHGIKHVQARTKIELHDGLYTSQNEEVDSVIEVKSCIEDNATFHSTLRKFSGEAAEHALSILSRLSAAGSTLRSFSICKIFKMEYSLYRIELYAPTTTSSADSTGSYREGFVLALSLEDGSVGFGEVAPLDIHKENLIYVEEQLRLISHVVEGANVSHLLPLLKGSFSSWIWNTLGILPASVFPSVRCGLEMAILNAIAERQGSSLLSVLHPMTDEETSVRSSNVKICALIDSIGTPTEVAYLATKLVEEGFTAIKLKVARRADPLEDAAVVEEVRKKVGHKIEIRADANRKWTYEEAIQFGSSVKNCDLQYIEEPVQYEDDIIKFCEETGLPIALDETIDDIQENPLEKLAKFTHPGVVAVVIKPSVVGGFENAALIARWAQQQCKIAVISATFESGLGLSSLIQFSSYLELQNTNIRRLMNKEQVIPVAHGLGTYKWLKEDLSTEPLKIRRNSYSGYVEASIVDADRLLRNFQINSQAILRSYNGEQVRKYELTIDLNGFSFSANVLEVGVSIHNNVVVFLHGFLGTGDDWIPIMKAISVSARCIAIDLPGHGQSKTQKHPIKESTEETSFSMEVVSEILYKLIDSITPRRVTIVGYSMGARIALCMALIYSHKVKGAVIISGSPGLKDVRARKIRRAKDDSRACYLKAHGLKQFLETWYAGELWNSLRSHPHFKQIVESRSRHDDVQALAKALSDLSIGRQPSMWEELKHCTVPLQFIVGERDRKFKRVALEMCREISDSRMNKDDPENKIYRIVEVPHCGHAAHLENPLPVITAIRQFLTRMNKEFNS